MENKFKTANEAFHYLMPYIVEHGVDFDTTRALFNVGFLIKDPHWCHSITNRNGVKRDFNLKYAKAEWQWYLSGDDNINKLGELYGKIPEIWKRMANDYNLVNSNYGYQWKRENQLDNIIAMLKTNPKTRQAAISIYDAKEINYGNYTHDTPCTYAVQFTILNNKLNMCVTMRSNDLWYGFCNDQYCFSQLQIMVAEKLAIPVGTYYHFAHNLHLYNNIIEKVYG
jgi:thymidylate synthase|tara:strand:- start:88 stop:762 length:675 start_codon:yes stop_codon:yes gene_type:complete